eukprot:1988952-Amphidinium_carterae.1
MWVSAQTDFLRPATLTLRCRKYYVKPATAHAELLGVLHHEVGDENTEEIVALTHYCVSQALFAAKDHVANVQPPHRSGEDSLLQTCFMEILLPSCVQQKTQSLSAMAHAVPCQKVFAQVSVATQRRSIARDAALMMAAPAKNDVVPVPHQRAAPVPNHVCGWMDSTTALPPSQLLQGIGRRLLATQ